VSCPAAEQHHQLACPAAQVQQLWASQFDLTPPPTLSRALGLLADTPPLPPSPPPPPSPRLTAPHINHPPPADCPPPSPPAGPFPASACWCWCPMVVLSMPPLLTASLAPLPPPPSHAPQPPPPAPSLPLQDFSGFRLLVLVPRERVMWPAPGQYEKPEAKKHPKLGAPLDPLPMLMVGPARGGRGGGQTVAGHQHQYQQLPQHTVSTQ
jgi:hypothetical protein